MLCVVGGKLNAINGQIEIQIGSKITVVEFKITVLSERDIVKITYVGTLSLTCKLTGTRYGVAFFYVIS